MELRFNIVYLELLKIIRELPKKKIVKLRNDLSNKKNNKEYNSLNDLLLKGSVMSDEQYNLIKENRKHFSKWRTK